jgi:cell division protein ZapA (FtsZ GTPase activity inhibitor)
MASLKEQVAQRISQLGPAVQDGVVDTLVAQVKEKRVKAVLTALNLIEETQKELKKIKPEQTFDADNKVVSEFFTKPNMEARKKAQEKIANIETALEAALGETPNFEKLFKVTQNAPAAE